MSLEDSIRRDLPDPREFKYSAYGSYIVGANDAMRAKLRQFFEEVDIDLFIREEVSLNGGNGADMHYSIFNIGSDGRHEKGATSPHDVMILSDGDGFENRGELNEILSSKFMSMFVKQNDLMLEDNDKRYAPGAHRVFSDMEAKTVTGSDGMFSYKQNDKASWPSRIIDADIVMPNGKDQLRSARLLLLDEMKNVDNGRLGKKIRQHEKDRLKGYSKITNSGNNTMRGDRVTHFDINTGEAIYNLSDDVDGVCANSFKHGPLRLVQTAVVLKIVDIIRSNDFTVESGGDLLSEMETQTVRKIAYLHSMGVSRVSPKVMSDLIDNYRYFLWLFHISEYEYYNNGNTVTDFNTKETAERLQDTIHVVSEFINNGKTGKEKIKL